jgi:hypothetical protein
MHLDLFSWISISNMNHGEYFLFEGSGDGRESAHGA